MIFLPFFYSTLLFDSLQYLITLFDALQCLSLLANKSTKSIQAHRKCTKAQKRTKAPSSMPNLVKGLKNYFKFHITVADFLTVLQVNFVTVPVKVCT